MSGYRIYRLDAVAKAGVGDLATLPYSLRILLENLLRYEDGKTVSRADIAAVASWNPAKREDYEVQLRPARVLMQDFTGVPAVCDLAAMRDAFAKLGLDPTRINPLKPAHLVIDHSVQVDVYGSPQAFGKNVGLEFERNTERYTFLRWGQQAFDDMKVVPPGTGIVHQVNVEYLAGVVWTEQPTASPRPSPTRWSAPTRTPRWSTAWASWAGASAASRPRPSCSASRWRCSSPRWSASSSGKLPVGATATDLVLTVTQLLRKKGVVDKFVEFYGDGIAALSLPDRATIANMAPEYGATMGFFPSIRRRSTTCASPAAPSSRCSSSSATPRRTSCGTTRRRSCASPTRSASTCRRSCRRSPARRGRRIACRCRPRAPRGARPSARCSATRPARPPTSRRGPTAAPPRRSRPSRSLPPPTAARSSWATATS
jgi:hypothetical protein